MTGELNLFLNQVIEGDCLEILPQLPSNCVDLILCDLPYGTTINPWDTVIDFDRLWVQYMRVLKPKGVVALTSAGRFTGTVINSNPDWFKYKIVWIKSKSTNFLNAKKQPLRRHEDICIFYSSQPQYHPQMIPGEPYNKGWRKGQTTGCYGLYKPSPAISGGKRYPYDILLIDDLDTDDWFYCKTCEHEETSPVHPTQKPVELGSYLIRTFTNPGDVILDNACGNGSFLVAAVREKRNFIGIEKNIGGFFQKNLPVDFIEVARHRVAQEQARMAR